MKTLRRTILVFTLALTQMLWAGTTLTPAETEKWREDIRYFAAEAPKTHKDLYHAVPREQFDASIQQLLERVPQLTREQVIVELLRIVADIGDGHTYTTPWLPQPGFHILPARFYLFQDGLYVIKAKTEYSSILGGRVTRIGNHSLEDVTAAVRLLVPRDNDMGVNEALPLYLATPEILSALGFADSAEQVNITVMKANKEQKIELKAIPGAELQSWMSWAPVDGWMDARTSTPLWLKHTNDNFWMEYLPDSKTMYVQYNGVAAFQGMSPGKFFQQAIQEADEKQAERFVIDVRLNSGGNNFLNTAIFHDFIRSDRFNQRGKLFTLIGRRTFSAAQNFVNGMKIHTETMFAGEPTGCRPNMYGDNVPLVLPNSKIEVRLSSILWQDMDPRDRRIWQAPDLSVHMTFDEYRDAKDPVLAAVLKYGVQPSLQETVRGAVFKNDMTTAKKAIKDYRNDPLNEFASAEPLLNSLGYALVNEHQMEAALIVFKINTEEFPNSSNVWDSLAETQVSQGNYKEALINYQKALDLHSNNPNIRNIIARLKEQQH